MNSYIASRDANDPDSDQNDQSKKAAHVKWYSFFFSNFPDLSNPWPRGRSCGRDLDLHSLRLGPFLRHRLPELRCLENRQHKNTFGCQK